jgi:AcrR family transcriptional regulator
VTANAAYRHFADKEDLLNVLAAEGFRRFADQQAQAVAPHVGATERLRASGMAYIAFATAHAPLFKLMFSRVSSPSIHTHQELQQASLSAMSVLLGEAADQMQVPAGDERALVMAAACWSLVHGLSELAQGGQLAVFGIEPHDLIERVMCLPGLIKA